MTTASKARSRLTATAKRLTEAAKRLTEAVKRQPPRARRRTAAIALIALIVLLIVAIAGSGSSAEPPPATGAAAVVPADALAYVHLSIDPARPPVQRALALAQRLPDYPLLRAVLLTRLGGIASGSGSTARSVDFATEIKPWLGKEAALAFLNTTTSSAGSLLVLDVSHQRLARAFLSRTGASPRTSYRGTPILANRVGTELAFTSHYLVVGQGASVRAALDVAAGAPSLQSSSAYTRAASGEPADRVLDAYASVDGMRRVLAPQGGFAGALSTLLYQPALTGVSIAVSPASQGASVRVHSALDPALARVRGPRAREFAPSLASVIPTGALLMLDVTGLDKLAPRLLSAGAVGGVGGGIGPLFRRLGNALQAEGVNVEQNLLSVFHGESAVAITPHAGKPALVVVARTRDEGSTATALAALEAPLAQLFPPPGSGPGQAPVFNDRQVAGITAHQLALAPGLELDYAVFDGLVVVSTSLEGIAGVRTHTRSLLDDPRYAATLGDHRPQLTSLLFLDLNQLLRLGERTGLTRSASFRALRPDLGRIRAIGLQSSSGEADSTAELRLQIP